MAAFGNSDTTKILESLLSILKEESVFDRTGTQPVIEFLHPDELVDRLPTSLNNEGLDPQEIQDTLRTIIRYSVKTSNPHFHNQLYGGMDKYGLAGAWLTEALNTSQYTFEVAPVFTILEKVIIEKSLSLIRYPKMPLADGILCPGGSISNMYGMVLARNSKFPEVKSTGLSGLPHLACFTSEDGHYSVTKGAHWLGLGTDCVYKIRTDGLGRMIPVDLKRAIIEAKTSGHMPIFVNATCGTTVLGAFDPICDIASICREENMWLHIDACLGGTLLLSEKYLDRLKGIELSNSVSWNPHKMLGVPFQCSLFLVKGENVLHESNCAGANYLFQKDKFYDVSWDTGDKSVQCGRKADGMKFWFMWKSRGSFGLKKSVDLAMSCAEYFFGVLKNRQGFRLVLPHFECTNICFWYIPPSIRGQNETAMWWQNLYKVAPIIKKRMIRSGTLMLGYTPLTHKSIGNFFRMVVCCQPPPSHSTMDYVVHQIEDLGADITFP